MSKVNIINIDGVEYNLGGEGGAARINAELYVYSDRIQDEEYTARKLFLRAPKDTINPETDVLEFARYKSMKDRWEYENRIHTRRRKGWIRPLPYNDITLRYAKDEEFSTDEMDYFEILPSVSEGTRFANEYAGGDYYSWISLGESIFGFESDHSGDGGYGGGGPASPWGVCGICVERDGKMITDYMRFSLTHHTDEYENLIVSIATTV